MVRSGFVIIHQIPRENEAFANATSAWHPACLARQCAIRQFRSLKEARLSYLRKEDGTDRPLIDYDEFPPSIEVVATPRSSIRNFTAVREWSGLRVLYMSYCHDADTGKPLTVDFAVLPKGRLETLYTSEHFMVNFDLVQTEFPQLRKLSFSNSLEFSGKKRTVDLDLLPDHLQALYIKGLSVRSLPRITRFRDLSILYIDHARTAGASGHLLAEEELTGLVDLPKLQTLSAIGLPVDWNQGIGKQLAHRLSSLIIE